MLVLHGFPEGSYAWQDMIGRFAGAGYRVLAPDQRGYNLSDKPRGASAYNSEVIARDVLGLIDASGCELPLEKEWEAVCGDRCRRACVLEETGRCDHCVCFVAAKKSISRKDAKTRKARKENKRGDKETFSLRVSLCLCAPLRFCEKPFSTYR